MTATHEENVPPITVVGVRSTMPLDELRSFFSSAFAQATDALHQSGLAIAGPPIAVYFGVTGQAVDVLAGFPLAVPEPPSAPGPKIIAATLPEGRAVTALHHGGYDRVGETYAEMRDWMHERGLGTPSLMSEQYLIGPDSGKDPAEWQTLITYYLPPDEAVPPAQTSATAANDATGRQS